MDEQVEKLIVVAQAIAEECDYYTKGHFDSASVSEDDIDAAAQAIRVISGSILPLEIVAEAKTLVASKNETE